MKTTATIESVITVLQTAGKVRVTGFGTFTLTSLPERMGRNPATGEPVHIGASVTVKFKPSASLKDLVNGR